MKKISKFNIIEKIVLYNIILLFALSIIILFACNGSYAFPRVEMAFHYSYLVLFGGSTIQKIAFILVVILFLLFIAYWITNILISRKVVLGPIYTLIFFLFVLYTDGYYRYIDDIDAYVVMMIIFIVVLLASAIVSFVIYLKGLNKLSKETSEGVIANE